MKIDVKLVGPLKQRFNGLKVKTMELPKGAEVKDILDYINLPYKGYMVAVNGMKVSIDYVLKDGDKVSIFPPTTGG